MASPTTIALTLIARRLQTDTDFNLKKNRIRMHRAVMLAQIAGMDKMFTFHWEKPGPYSTTLARHLEQIRYESLDGPIDTGDRVLTERTERAVRTTGKLLTSPDPERIESQRWERAVAILAYLSDIGRSESVEKVADRCEIRELLPEAQKALRTFGISAELDEATKQRAMSAR